MAASIRKHEGCDNENERKKQKSDSHAEKINNFLSWCERRGLNLNKKVKISRENSAAHYGMFADDDVAEGEVLFEIPRNLLLKPENSAVVQHITSDQEIYKCKSGWVPVILTVMYEFHQADSKWRSYLDIVPNFEDIELPLFWEESEFEELCGTSVKESVQRDEENISKEFSQFVLPFIQRHSELFSASCHNLEFYKKMVAFVMAYSFTEPADEDDSDDEDTVSSTPPMMVPMADILNHVAKNNANLSFGTESLKMVTTRDISKGEEIYNTYGQLPNHQLLHMYGFAEKFPNNHYDTVEMPVYLLHKVVFEDDIKSQITMLEEKWKFLEKMGVLIEDGSFVLGVDGILTEEEILLVLKVFDMTKEKFEEYKENEGWSDADSSDGNEISLDFGAISEISDKKKNLLSRYATLCLEQYKIDEAVDEKIFTSNAYESLTKRKQMCLHVRYGQRKLLHKLIKECQT